MNRTLPSAQLQAFTAMPRKTLCGSKPAPLALEARLMFDGAAIATERPVIQPEATGAEAAVQPLDKGIAAVETKAPREAAEAPPSTAAPREIVFVDPGVTDWQKLLQGKPQDAVVIMLDPARDGLSQMAEALQGKSGIDAIHVISHGSDGRLILGGKNVDQTTLAAHADDLQKIGQALGTNGDILLYGCDIARGSAGAAFVDAVARATGADVAASTDATGSAAKGGDWALEYAAGQIDAAPVVRAADVSGYNGLLASSKVTIDLDQDNSSGATGFDYQATYDYREGRYPVCDSDALIQLADGLTWENVGGVRISIEDPKPGDRLDLDFAYDHKVYISEGASWVEFKAGWREQSLADWYDSIKRVNFIVNTADNSDRTIKFTIWERTWSGLRDGYAYATIKVPVNNPASISVAPGSDNNVVEAGAGVAGDASAGGRLTVSDDIGQTGFRVPANGSLNGAYGRFTFNASTGDWGYSLDNVKADKLTAGQSVSDMLTVRSYDGTASYEIKVNIAGSNDAAVISGTGTANLSETDAILTTSGKVNVSDVDGAAMFKAQSNVLGSNAYGRFSLAADGSWNYETSSAHNEFVAGRTYTDRLTVESADGTKSTITVSILGTNDAAVITGTAAGSVTEDVNVSLFGNLKTTGTLAVSDPDAGESEFRTTVSSGSGAWGDLQIGRDGKWAYLVANRDVQGLKAGETHTDTFTVRSEDGTATQTISVTIHGANDAPQIVPWPFGGVMENADISTVVYSARATDRDQGDALTWSLAGADAAAFTIDANGDVRLKSSANFEVKDQYRLTVVASDALKAQDRQDVLILVGDADDPTVVSGDLAGSIDENATKITGDLNASDEDSAANFFEADQRGKFGRFVMDPDGNWSYTLNSPMDRLAAGQTLSETFTIYVHEHPWGEKQAREVTVTIVGTNDAAVISGDKDGQIVESDVAQSVGGKLSATDVDGPGKPVPRSAESLGSDTARAMKAIDGGVPAKETFFIPSEQIGQYGRFEIARDGTWNYVMDGPHNEFEQGKLYTDSFIVRTADGTEQKVTVTIEGTSDVVPRAKPAATANLSGSERSPFADSPSNPLRVAGMRGDLNRTSVPGQNFAQSGGSVGFNPEALVAQAPTAAGMPADLSGFERFELVRAEVMTSNDDWVVHVKADRLVSFGLPESMMKGPQAPDFVVVQSDGQPLPEWLAFDPNSGMFAGKTQPEMAGRTIRLQLTGPDAQGQERVVRILLTVDRSGLESMALESPTSTIRVSGEAHGRTQESGSEALGRASLSEQLRAHRQHAAPPQVHA